MYLFIYFHKFTSIFLELYLSLFSTIFYSVLWGYVNIFEEEEGMSMPWTPFHQGSILDVVVVLPDMVALRQLVGLTSHYKTVQHNLYPSP